MREFIRKAFASPVFEGDEEKTRTAQYLNVFLWTSILVVSLLQVWRSISAAQIAAAQTTFIVLGLIVLMLVVQFVLRLGHVRAASILLLIMGWGAFNYQAKSVSGIYDSTFFANILLIILAGMLINFRASLAFAVLTIMTGWGLAYLQTTGASPSAIDTPYNIARDFTVIFILVAILIYVFQNSLRGALEHLRANASELANSNKELQSLHANLENRVEERTAELELANEKNLERADRLRTVADISRTFTGVKNLDALLPEIARKISEAFGFYHVGIFLNDPQDDYAVLRASNSPGGQKMLARGHRLKIGQIGIVGFTTGTGQPRIALDVGEDFIYFDNPDLPNTRSEMALPLQSGGKIIGALDVQSIARAAFGPEDIDTLSLLADQISIAIQNSLLFEETNAALAEVREIYQRATQTSWQEIAQQGKIGFRFANGSVEPLTPDAASPKDETADKDRQGKNPEILSIPISVRGQTLGSLNIRQPGRGHDWSTTESRLYQSIVERMSFALENARLLEDTLNRATREQKVVEISTKVGSSVRIEQILQTTAEEISRAFGGAEVLVQLQPGTKGKDS
jgi:GAF domain-containing protein